MDDGCNFPPALGSQNKILICNINKSKQYIKNGSSQEVYEA